MARKNGENRISGGGVILAEDGGRDGGRRTCAAKVGLCSKGTATSREEEKGLIPNVLDTIRKPERLGGKGV